MYETVGYYLQMVAAFLLLSLTHYFASAFLPMADCDETFNYIEPVHYLLYGSGKQTWELCERYALRSWLFLWIYAWPAVLLRGAASLSSADVFYYLRIFNGRIAALAELFFVYSVWSAFSGKAAMIALLLLLVNYPIPHAAVSVMPTSFAMICNFVALGCWLRTGAWSSSRVPAASMHGSAKRRTPRYLRWSVGLALFFSVCSGIISWPFAGLVSVPIGLDLLLRFPTHAALSTAGAVVVVVVADLLVNAPYYCRWVLSSWNVATYNIFGGADRGPDLLGTEPWFFFWKNLILNFNLMFVTALCAPLVVLCTVRRAAPPSGSRFAGSKSRSSGVRNGNGHPRQRESPRRLSSSGEVRPAALLATSPASSLTRTRVHHSAVAEAPAPQPSCWHAPLNVAAAAVGCSCGRELLYMAPFFLWFTFWMCIEHKEERFMAPAYPFMVLAGTRAICLAFFPDVERERHASTPAAVVSTYPGNATAVPVATAPPPPALPRRDSPHQPRSIAVLAWRRAAGFAFLAAFFLLSYSRAMAVYSYYSGPERLFYDWYPVLRAAARQRWEEKQALAATGQFATTRGTTPQQTNELNAYFTLCLGREWYRFPSSFFADHRYARYQFLSTSSFHGMLPMSFVTAAAGEERGLLWAPPGVNHAGTAEEQRHEGGSCTCGAAHVSDLSREISEQYVQDPIHQCDAVFDSLPPPAHVSAAEHAQERRQLHLDTVFTRSLLNTTAMRAVLAAEGTLYRHVDDAYAVIDVDRTPMWCRVLYYPFGISKRCAVWRPLVLNAKP
ncbi:putative mitochondrial dolichyl-P-Man:GDP-Man5GlcNAc2-PP-dolichyl alpha-1,2-mannosyltransferase [Leptomonas pyrrhocoris]|uniref:Mannosyltransferase n=1 Tax=Leptomonas pyrrhocoris TaxID=157538 RepID=A0A0N0DSE6_LEPPY|nr:putative mitochondrial dolichyl-P-Man:GDP-Man5GlcNAc2-PP-dolichyl alpha-1,2-mannosyltransferase [Leptomonas pyrrhocoris]XP_015654262.1 putative mitochondrial dolichyl-P-Man:GDP-Man5GlcNAc2-PP-dolichyl alpha-1,2-mannosyltransferase [Leptomonas pyrrhocoris]KPA75822.1 putative mitochondrial dolichyl-P-Man:GDP-Man5GlcNAc2-PP-dolichyl alpha-1,2-mannosyltransferase [Leptomonas pyrrhocoris]KPA75823.1 putative mitochondrial dolichyl-P-Man:GDP-Man5GlcNAc2-PP-dolichyl alpha-1,2-mannosyltransferase [Lep|eukprot:XP_015654261.1 putative mitochondrial dolichyl-P-Man:GDP-Man5GlcNAc2-PP-dolichyl alpha-1,2-mannosyltransferase [Leptomonas pyrrhocoris]